MFRSVNPFDQSLVGETPADDDKAISRKIQSSSKAFSLWRREPITHRSALLTSVAGILRKNKLKYAGIITLEMGKVLSEAIAEVEKCATACDFFATHADEFLSDEMIASEAKSFVAFQPLGPVLAIMPWNFPFWQVFRFAAPAIMAGNTALLKHAANVPQCALAIQSIFREAGLPPDVFQSLMIDSRHVEKIIAMDEIAAVTLTGSEQAGTHVASAAGANIKKTVLELGGSDPFIVLEDADLEEAARVATTSRMQNAGQSCIAAKRFIVLAKVKDEFTERFKTHIEALRQGDPMKKETTTGPVARIDLAENLEDQLRRAVEEGARLVTGGSRTGCNFRPALLDDVRPGNTAFDEEIFGPIASIVGAHDVGEAVALANRSRFGLGASVWTSDTARGEAIARDLECGCVFVNSMMRSDSRFPFGGVKRSGYGRELSRLGIREFVNAKTIYVASQP